MISSSSELLKNTHSALSDVAIVACILSHICQVLGVRSVVDLYKESELAQKPMVMTFGKHKDLLLTDVPGDYHHWLLNQADIDPHLRKALEA